MSTVITILTLAIGARVASAQVQPPCLPLDHQGWLLLNNISHKVSFDDPAAQAGRTALGLPFVASGEVTHVTTKAVCEKALQAYRANVPHPERMSNHVYVLEVGKRYVVMDSSYYIGRPGQPLVQVFDDRWVLLSKSG